jgi:VWFA-related protein
VRDSQGRAVGNLRQEDFQVFDKGKPQVITQFEVERPGELTAKVRREAEQTSGEPLPEEQPSETGKSIIAPERYVGYLFDDVHLEFGDLAQTRMAAERHFSTLRLTDRAAIFTTSGQTQLDFTDDRARLHETLVRLQPRPISGFRHDCPDISYYQADQIVNKHDPLATDVAIKEAIACEPVSSTGVPMGNPIGTVNAVSASALNTGEHESRVSLDTL